jgi:hypothetical protein
MIRRILSRISREALAVVTGATAALAVTWMVAPAALLPAANAALPESCLDAHTGSDDDYGQIDAEERDGSTADDLRGLRSDVWVATSSECQRISSVFVFSPTHNGVYEFGWFRGWWGTDPCSGVDHGHFYVNATVFSVWEPNSGSGGCTVWGDNHPTSTFHLFRGSDIDANTYWGGYLDGVALQPNGVNLDFARGYGGVNMERGHPDDSGFAEFDNINEYHDGNGWTVTNNLDQTFDNDPDFHLSILNNHHVEMVQ